jgi:flagellar basal-body rod protein FlgB
MDRLDTEFKFGQQALDLRAYRQTVLSSNIANADTPGYQARDMDFASTLKAAVGGAASPDGSTTLSTSGGAAMASMATLRMASTEAGHLAGNAGSGNASYGNLMYRQNAQPALDNNTVDLDTERVSFADNALHYETGLTVMTQQIKTMITAITSGS